MEERRRIKRKRVLNSLTNQEIDVGDGPFMKAVRTRHKFYHEDSNRLVLIPSLKRMIELEEMKVMIMMKMVVPSLIVSFEKSD